MVISHDPKLIFNYSWYLKIFLSNIFLSQFLCFCWSALSELKEKMEEKTWMQWRQLLQ